MTRLYYEGSFQSPYQFHFMNACIYDQAKDKRDNISVNENINQLNQNVLPVIKPALAQCSAGKFEAIAFTCEDQGWPIALQIVTKPFRIPSDAEQKELDNLLQCIVEDYNKRNEKIAEARNAVGHFAHRPVTRSQTRHTEKQERHNSLRKA